MLLKLLNLGLLVVALAGGVLAYRATREHRELVIEHRRLARMVGYLTIDDPSKVHVRALDTGEPLFFAWRVYLPAGFHATWRNSQGGSSHTWESDPCEFIAQVRIREGDDGQLTVYTRQGGGSSRFGFGNRPLAELLHDRWDQIQIQQLGSDDVVVVEPNEVVTMLRLTLPDELQQRVGDELGITWRERLKSSLFEMKFGSTSAFAAVEAANASSRP